MVKEGSKRTVWFDKATEDAVNAFMEVHDLKSFSEANRSMIAEHIVLTEQQTKPSDIKENHEQKEISFNEYQACPQYRGYTPNGKYHKCLKSFGSKKLIANVTESECQACAHHQIIKVPLQTMEQLNERIKKLRTEKEELMKINPRIIEKIKEKVVYRDKPAETIIEEKIIEKPVEKIVEKTVTEKEYLIIDEDEWLPDYFPFNNQEEYEQWLHEDYFPFNNQEEYEQWLHEGIDGN